MKLPSLPLICRPKAVAWRKAVACSEGRVGCPGISMGVAGNGVSFSGKMIRRYKNPWVFGTSYFQTNSGMVPQEQQNFAGIYGFVKNPKKNSKKICKKWLLMHHRGFYCDQLELSFRVEEFHNPRRYFTINHRGWTTKHGYNMVQYGVIDDTRDERLEITVKHCSSYLGFNTAVTRSLMVTPYPPCPMHPMVGWEFVYWIILTPLKAQQQKLQQQGFQEWLMWGEWFVFFRGTSWT